MYKNILLAVDREHEASARLSFQAALEHCRASGARLHVLTVVHSLGVGDVASFLPMDFEQQMLEKAARALRDLVERHIPSGLEVEQIVAQGKVYAEILRVAGERGVDLIIMASHHPEVTDYLLGSNAAHVVRHADCSVLIVRDGSPS